MEQDTDRTEGMKNMNNDLISRKETIRYIRENLPLGTFMQRGIKQADAACWNVCNMIADEVPSVNPERKGKWISVDSETVNGRCSVCGYESYLYENDVYGEHYCPNCGARLDIE